MYAQKIHALLNRIPELTEWTEINSVFKRAGNQPHPDWEIPIMTCEAVGGEKEDALVGAAIIACQQLSIILVDDILDDDENGEHIQKGVGPTANLALAIQAASYRLLDFAPITPMQKTEISECISSLAIATAFGQHLDVQNLKGEENYWKVVKAKSTPFYARAYQIGSILGHATEEIKRGLYEYGELIGEIIQLEDDLQDAFKIPANPDWLQGRNNLLILFSHDANHPAQQRFQELLNQIPDEKALKEAQQILIESGAVSFCAYQLMGRYKEAKLLLASLELKNPTPLIETLNAYSDSLVQLLSRGGFVVTKEMLMFS